jgi:general secretion pathway protein D
LKRPTALQVENGVERLGLRHRCLVCLVFAGVLLAGCAAKTAYRDAQILLAQDQAQEALAKLSEAVRMEPTSVPYRMEYLRTRDRLVSELLLQAQRARDGRLLDSAEAAYRKALQLHPANEAAIAGIKQLERERRLDRLLSQARSSAERKDLENARAQLRAVLAEDPANAEAARALAGLEATADKGTQSTALAAALRRSITLEVRDVSLRTAFELLSQTSGLSFVFDKDVRTDQRITLILRNGTVEQAMSRLLVTSQLEQRALDTNTLLIYPDTPAKQREHLPLTVRAFYLSHADAKGVSATLKSLLKVRDLVTDERLNLVVIRDTPETVRMAERVVALHDLPDPEVMLEVEVLEVKRTSLLDLGIRWPEQLSLTPLVSSAGAAVTLADLKQLGFSRIGTSVGPTTVTANRTSTDANILANPRIRAKNREKARILIGDRIPNITSTSTSTGFVSESVNYLDVGLKLEVEPSIHPNGEVAIKLALEVSSIVKQLQTQSGTFAFQIGTRNVSTVLRLKDGENQMLAGLISDEDRRNARRIPGLGDVPVAGRLFGGQADDTAKTEIILSITPRIVRGAERPDSSLIEFESGTESGGRHRGGDAGGFIQPSASGMRFVGEPTVPRPGAPPPAPSPAHTGPGLTEARGGWPADLDMKLTGPTQVRTGQSFNVDVFAQARRAFQTLPLAIAVDPMSFEVVEVIAGEFGRDSKATLKLESRIDQGGQVLATISTLSTPDTGESSGAGDLAGRLLTLRLKALGQAKTSSVRVLTAAAQSATGDALAIPLPPPLQVEITP